jgi:tetratricopeptide (TPR) repeat protein
MGFPSTFLVLLIVLSFSALVSGQEEITPNEKAARYHRILQKKPDNATLFSRFVESWLDTDSKENLQIWIEQSTKDGSPADWQILSSLHDYLGQDEAALRALNNAVKAAPGNAPLRLTRAKLNARLLDFETALLDLKFAADDPKIGTEASKLQGIYLARSGRIEEALVSWEALVEKLPEDEELREDLIESQVVEGLLQEAAAGAGDLAAMTRDPFKKALRQLRLGDLQIMSEDREAGLQTYETIIATTGADTWLEREVLAQIERVFLRDDDMKGLRAFYQKLSEAHPRRISIRRALARQMAASGEVDEAIALFREILKITPGDLGNREEFITFLEASEKWSLARLELMAILKERQDDPSLWERLFRLEITLKNPTGIRSALEKIHRIRAQSPEGLIAVANLYQQAELAEDAAKLLREGQKKFPDIDEITEALASLLIENNQEGEALALWQMMANGANREDLLRVSRSLSSHGKQSEAFQLLASRLGPSGDFEDDPLLLAQLCQLARSEQEAALAIGPGRKLISLATAPTELENAVRLTRQLILRADQIQRVLATPPVTIGEKCLHASLIAHLGDVPRASRLLEEAATDDPGKLLHFFRIRFEEEFGNTDQAIALLRELVASPEGKKTVHHRRLVDLLESSGNEADALKAVGEWKKIAPGNQAAWLRRADLLLAIGRPGDAATELRRAAGKFGGDQENLPRLAEALLEDGQTRPAKTIYERLFEESGDLAGKIKWVGKLATVAKQDDTLPSLLAGFERRKRAAPNSVAPLLAIAEIHRQNFNQELRRTALLEASRRRPGDLALRLNIAQEEERHGEFARAASILREALKNDKNNQIKRGLANLHLRMGEIQTGLRLLSGIPGENEKPRNLEKTVITLITGREIRAAAQHLESHLNKHREDWRLQYLHAMLLDLTQESQKSFQAFLLLGHSDGEIPGLRPLLGPGGRNPIRTGEKTLKGTPTGWDELQHFYSLIRRESSSLLRTLRGRSSQSNLITLPGTAREARLMSILQACHLANSLEDEEKKNAAFAKLKLPESPGFPLFLAVRFDINDDLLTRLSEAIKKTPDSLFHLQLWLRHEIDRGADGSDVQRLAAFNRLAKEAPLTAGGILAKTCQNGDIMAEQIPALFESVFDQAPIDKLPDLLSNFSDLDDTLDYYDQKTVVQVAGVLFKNALRMKEIPKGGRWNAGPFRYVLQERDPEKMITLLNFVGASPNDSNEPEVGIISYRGFLSSGGESSLLIPPPFPRTWFGNLPYLMNALHEQSFFEPDPDEEKRLRLLAQISPEFAREPVKGPLEFLRGHEHKIKPPLFRDLIAASLSPREALPKIAARFATTRDPEQLLFASGYFYQEDDLTKCFAILKRLNLLPLSRDMRSVCDGHLTHLGALLKSQKADDYDPDPAIKAALRLRRQLVGEERDFLSDHLVVLGLQKEARQLNRTSNRSPRPIARPGPSTGAAAGRAGIIFHMLRRNEDAAIREGTKTLMAELRSDSSSNVRRTIAVLRSFKLSDEVLARMTPGADASRERRVEFAGLTAQMGRKDLALQSYRDLLIDDPNDHESQAVILALTPLETWQTEKISPEVLSRLSSHLPNDFEKVLTVYELATSHLNSLPPAGGGKRDLSWINQFIKKWHNQSEFESLAIPSLMSQVSSNRSYYDQDATKRRDLAHDRLLRAMAKHPETVQLAFRNLVGARKRLEVTDDELRDFARKALIDFGDQSEDDHNNDPFGDPLSLPISNTMADYLLDIKDLEFFYSEETLKAIARNQPGSAALFSLLRELHHGPDDRALAALQTWEKEIAKDPESKSHRLAELCRLLSKLQPAPGPWSEHFQKLVLAHAATLPDPDSPELFGNWIRYLTITRGKDSAIDFVEKVFETHLFSRQKWPLCAEITYHHLPKELRSRLAFCSAIAGNIVRQEEMDSSATSLLILLKKTSLAEIFEEANHLLSIRGFDRDDFWDQISGEPEQTARLISQLGLLRPSDPSDLPFFADLLTTSHEWSRNNDQDWQKKVAHLVRNQKDNHPFLTGILIAPLLNASERGSLKRQLVTDFPTLVQQCLDHAPRKFGDFFKSPGGHESDSNSLIGKFFAGLEKENHRQTLGKVDQWLKDDMPLGNPESGGSSIWWMVRDLSDFDPERANSLVEQTFQKLRSWPKAYQGSIRSGDKHPPTFDAWTSNLSETLLGNLSDENVATTMFVYDRLIRGEVMEMSNCPIPVFDSSDPFSSLLEQGSSISIWFSGDDDEVLNQLQEVAPKLNAKQQLSLILLSAGDGAISRGPASPKPAVFYKKIDEELRPISPIFANALMVFRLTRNFPDLPENELSQSLALLQKSRLALLSDRSLPIPTRLLFISKLADIDPVKGSLFQDTALAEATLKDFGEYLALPLPPIPSIVGHLIEAFSASPYLATPERAADFLDFCRPILNSTDLSFKELGDIKRALVTPVFTAGRHDLLREWIKDGSLASQGDIDLLLGLSANGMEDQVKQFLPAIPSEYYSSSGHFQRDWPARIDHLLTLVPANHRLSLALAIASCPTAPGVRETSRKERLHLLARQAPEQLPKDLAERVRILKKLADSPEGFTLLREVLLREIGDLEIQQIAIAADEGPDRKLAGNLFLIFKQILQNDLAEGRTTRTLKQLESLANTSHSSRSTAYSIASSIIREAFPIVVQRAIEQPDQARKLAAFSRQILDLSFSFGGRMTYLSDQALALVVATHALADDFPALENHLADPAPLARKMARYRLLQPDHSYLFSRSNLPGEFSSLKPHLTNALLCSEWIQKNLAPDGRSLSELLLGNFSTSTGLLEAVEKLPDSHPLKATYLENLQKNDF